MLEKKVIPFEIKAETATEDGRFSGYGAVFGNVDSYGDIIEKGAFSEGIEKRGIQNIPMLWQHDHKQPIGLYEKIQEDNFGLDVDGKVLKDLTVLPAKDAIILIKNKVVRGLSIGYEVVKKKFNKNGNRILSKIDTWEISPVTFAANPLATITNVKSIETKRGLEEFLREAGLSHNAAKYLVSRHSFQRDVENIEILGLLNDLKKLNSQIGG